MRRRIVVAITALVAFAGLALVFVRVCADGGAMASIYQTCECSGIEWERYDRTPADGPRRTLCIGLIRSTTCHQFRGGPVVPCDG
jgi:hypothetical protein